MAPTRGLDGASCGRDVGLEGDPIGRTLRFPELQESMIVDTSKEAAG